MKSSACLGLVFALALAAGIASADAPDANVLVLTDANFEDSLVNVDVALVEFYAPWCGHCKALEPKWNEAADILKEKGAGAGVRLAKMDADSEKTVPGKFGVGSFPTIKLFRFGAFSEEFEGDRNVDAIVQYLEKKAAVAVNKELTNVAAVKALNSPKKAKVTSVVGFFSDKTSVDYKYFAAVAAEFASTGLEIYHVSSGEVLEGFGFYSSGSTIQIYRPGQKPFKVTYRGTLFKAQLREWMLKHALPSYGNTYTPDTEGLFRMNGNSVVRFLTTPKNFGAVSKDFQKKLSTAHPDLLFAVGDAADFKNDATAHCDAGVEICVLATEGPRFKKGKGRTFGSTGAYSEAMVEEFVSDFEALKLKTKVKSEPSPPAPKAGKVGVLVGTNFEELVGQAERGVFIKFYAPWCGHCKTLAPKFEELATNMAASFDDILIAKIDMTANDLPSDYSKVYAVSGFPTIYFVPKGKPSSPIKFEGGREVDAMQTWIQEKLDA